MEVHEKLSHLSEQELQELLLKYSDKKYPIKNIITEYQIDIISKSKLRELLPSVHINETCEYCGYTLMKKLIRKNNKESDDIFCCNCNHIVSSSSYRFEGCKCDGCKNKKLEYQNTLKVEIYNYYNNQTHVHYNFEELSSIEQFMLLYLIKENTASDFTMLNPLLRTNDKIYDDALYDKIESIHMLYNTLTKKDIISISPISCIEAFSKDNFPEIPYYKYATYNINVNFTEKEKQVIQDKTYHVLFIKNRNKLLELWNELIFIEVMQKFNDWLSQSYIEFNINEIDKEKFIFLLGELNYGQMLYLSSRSASNTIGNVVRRIISRKYVKENGLANFIKYCDTYIKNGSSIPEVNYDKYYINDWLIFFLLKIIRRDIDILRNIPVKVIDSIVEK